MRNTVTGGRIFGAAAIAFGTAAIAAGAFGGESAAERRDRELCEIRRGMTPALICPATPGLDRPMLVAGGAGLAATGMGFLLLAGILATLLDLRDTARARAAQADRARPLNAHAATTPARLDRGPAPADMVKPPPSRFEYLMRYGEALGSAAWQRAEAAQQAGRPMSMEQAVAEARAELAK